MKWKLPNLELPLDGRPLVMGILNVTPDSFSDGGNWSDPEAAIARGMELVRQGADILDIGGESTRPGAVPVDETAEAERILPVVRELAGRAGVPISVDTRHAAVARAALAAGAAIINDVMPFAGDVKMAAAAREFGAGLVLMHSFGWMATAGKASAGRVTVDEVEFALREAVEFAVSSGISRDSLTVDPGLGFGKDTASNLAILAALPRLAKLAPVLVGASRKRFVGEVCREPEAALRDGGSVAAALWAARRGAKILRVHAVRETRQALEMAAALDAAGERLTDV
ncbi:MAG: dihydropteroate synthase [Kiritimatiellae bacterium]|nr:dihydropteroate synthase [Kiritimatiellia bacterium]